MSGTTADSPSRRNGRVLPEHFVLPRFLQGMNRFFARVYHHLDVYAPARLPANGPAILICNHTSGLDPHLIQSCCPRLITWLMAKEYYEIRGLKTLLDYVGVIPVTRSGRDMAATRAALRALEQGQILGIFPEGKIETSDELLPFQTGVAMMALRSKAPVFPAYLDGTQRNRGMTAGLILPHRARIAFGPEVAIDRAADDRPALDAATAAMQSAVESLRQLVINSRSQHDL
jgi:1-acyl-sn-glycerol-3-phosphate acyltransferase